MTDLPNREFNGRLVEVIDFDDVSSGGRVIEFRDAEYSASDSLIAITIPDGKGWANARVSLNPRASDVSAELMAWAISTARETVD